MATTSRRPLVLALLTVVLAVVLLSLAGQFGPTGASAAASTSVGVDLLAQDPSAPAGPALDPAPTEGDRSLAQNKIIIGVVCAVLLGTVIMGNRIRSARRKKIGAQTS